MRKLRMMVAVAALPLVAPMLTSCSSSSNASAPDGAASPIPVGVIGSFTGPTSSTVGPGRDAIDAWGQWVNAHGGINGHPVKLYIEDDAANSGNALTRAKVLIEQRHVVAIVAAASADPAAWQQYVDSKGVPVVGGYPGLLPYLKDPNFFAVGGSLFANYYGITQVAKNNGTKIGDLYCAEAPSCAATPKILQTAGKSAGVQLAYQNKVTATAPDYTAACQSLKSAGVETFTLGLAVATSKRLVPQCREQGMTAKLVLSNVTDSTFVSNPAFDGMTVIDSMVPWAQTSTPATQEYHNAIAQYAPKLGTDAEPLGTYATAAWVSGKLFQKAVEGVGSAAITPDSIKKALWSMKGETLDGLTAPLTFVEGQPNRNYCYFVSTIQGGNLVTQTPLTPTCAPKADVDAIITAILGG